MSKVGGVHARAHLGSQGPGQADSGSGVNQSEREFRTFAFNSFLEAS